jgi:cyclophilin family peptidyl-prolyl cis-trans isomerase
MNNATILNRLLFQNNTANANTEIGGIPNGTATATILNLYNSSDPANSASFRIFTSATESRIGSVASGTGTHLPITMHTNGAERLRITTGGDVGIGTSSPVAKFDVVQSSNATNSGRTAYIRSSWSGDASTSALTVSKFDNDSTTSQFFVTFEINNTSTPCGRITANGANTAAFGSTSDERVKEKIVNLPSQLDNIMSLRPVEFNYIETYGGGHQIGFIAQEMQAVYPDVVSSDDSAEKILSITGWSKTEARLVKAIQELKAELDSVKAELQNLKGN